MALIPPIAKDDWVGLNRVIRKLASLKLGPTSQPAFAGLTLVNPLTVGEGGTGAATLTDHGILLGSGTDAVTPLGVAGNGQIPIGSVGADPVLAEITGTANQITSTPGAGTITLSLPQNINIAANVQFASVTLNNTGLHLLDTNASHDLIIAPGSDLTADRTLTLTTGDAARTITLSGNPTLADWFDQSVKQAATPTFAGLTLVNAITEFSTDGTMGGNSNNAVPTEAAIVTYVTALSSVYQPLDADLTNIAILGTAADKMLYTTAADTWTEAAITAFARTILDDVNEAAFKATVNLEIGTDVQAYDADLTTYAGITPSANVQSYLGAADYAAMKTLLSLNVVENTALSTWAGTTNITTLGTIGTVGNITIAANGTIGQAAGPLLTFDDGNNYLEITGCKVGIGTATPTESLHVFSTAANLALIESSDADTYAGWSARNDQGDNARYDFLIRGSTSALTRFGHGMANWVDFTGYGSSLVGMVVATFTEIPLTFGTFAQERMRISGSGDVGIGITVHASKLHVAGGTVQVGMSASANSYANRENVLIFNRADVPTNYLNKISSSVSGTPADNTINFELQTGSDTNILVMTLNGAGNVGIGTDTPDTKLQVVGNSGFGDDAGNELLISDTGIVTLAGTAKRDLTLRADLDYTLVTAQGKPTQVIIGIMHGYSLPLYAADEELYFNENVPGRWDGASDIKFHVLVALASAETAGETFKFQLSWNQVGETDIVPATSHDTTDEIVVVDGTQYATYMLEFVIDHDVDAGDVIVPHDDLAGRLRRVASTGDEVDGEVIVLDWHTHYTVDKMFKAPD